MFCSDELYLIVNSTDSSVILYVVGNSYKNVFSFDKIDSEELLNIFDFRFKNKRLLGRFVFRIKCYRCLINDVLEVVTVSGRRFMIKYDVVYVLAS